MIPTPSHDRPPAVAVLDVNETLSDLRGLVPRFERAGADPGILATWFAGTLRDGFAITAGGGYADFAAIAVALLAAELSAVPGLRGRPGQLAEEIVTAMAELDLHPDVAAGLERLHGAGVRLVTLSNGSSAVAESLLARAGLDQLVERCLSVSEAGRWKPAPEAYALAAARCGVAPEELVMIAVHPWDIDGARRAGLRTGWLSRDGAGYPPHMLPADVTAADFGELASRLV